jgi:uncharacterized membrane protein YphA (DoxX/SURF4 family)
MSYALVASRWTIALLLWVAAARKLSDFGGFRETVERYGVVPPLLLSAVARLLPIVEIVLGLSLAAGVMLSIAGLLAGLLMLGFAVSVAWNLVSGRRFDCGCGLGQPALISWRLVLRDVGLAGLAFFGALGPSTQLALLTNRGVFGAPSASVSVLVPIPMIIVLLACAARLQQLYWQFKEDVKTGSALSTLQFTRGVGGLGSRLSKEVSSELPISPSGLRS